MVFEEPDERFNHRRRSHPRPHLHPGRVRQSHHHGVPLPARLSHQLAPLDPHRSRASTTRSTIPITATASSTSAPTTSPTTFRLVTSPPSPPPAGSHWRQVFAGEPEGIPLQDFDLFEGPSASSPSAGPACRRWPSLRSHRQPGSGLQPRRSARAIALPRARLLRRRAPSIAEFDTATSFRYSYHLAWFRRPHRSIEFYDVASGALHPAQAAGGSGRLPQLRPSTPPSASGSTAPDASGKAGVMVPVSLVYRRDLLPQPPSCSEHRRAAATMRSTSTATAPTAMPFPSGFSPARLSLLDRGVVARLRPHPRRRRARRSHGTTAARCAAKNEYLHRFHRRRRLTLLASSRATART